MIMPVAVLTLFNAAALSRFTRSSVLDNLNEDYVRTARSKGLGETTILYAHVFKNAAISIVTLMGDELAGFMNGSTIVEVIFGWPGIGKMLIDAINARDLPVVTAAVFVIALMVMVVNLAVDLIYSWLDPRISYS